MSLSFQHDSFVILKGHIRRIRAQRACKEIKEQCKQKILTFLQLPATRKFFNNVPWSKMI